MDLPKIDSGLPIPEARRGKHRQKYPFHEMKVGDSFFIPVKEENGKWNASKMNNRITSSARSYQRTANQPNFRVVVRKVEENGVSGVRCWRVEDANGEVKP